MKSLQLSKSDYLLFLKHPCWLWLKKNKPSLLPPIDEATQAMFDAGFLFESYVEQLFPEGIKLNWEGYNQYKDLPQRTREAILSGAKVIMQGRFEAGQITCICDVVKFIDDKTIELYEIKSSTSVKPYHEHDLAFQAVVLQNLGYEVRSIFVVHVNKEFVRDGEIKAKDLANVVDVTENVKKRIEKTRDNIQKAIELATCSEMPDPSPSHCGLSCTLEWIEIYKKLRGITSGDGSIYDLYNLNATLIRQLEERGIDRLIDIPEDIDLGDKRKWQLKATKANEKFIDKGKIRDFLDKLEYPLYFLDYETLSSVVPYFDGHRPFQQVPFQYSLHIINKPGGELRHIEYLHSDNSDPVRPLSESLKDNIGSKGSVLVWWEDFEKSRNTEMGEMLPEFRKFYEDLNSRVIDLIIPFSEFYYVDKDFGGSASIKSVLPVLVPELRHKDLDISEGGTAQRLWMEAILDGKRPEEKEKILKDLWDYCKLDTLAMVRIWEFLKKI